MSKLLFDIDSDYYALPPMKRAELERDFWREAFLQLMKDSGNKRRFIVNPGLDLSSKTTTYIQENRIYSAPCLDIILTDEAEREQKLVDALKATDQVPTPEMLRRAIKQAYGYSIGDND